MKYLSRLSTLAALFVLIFASGCAGKKLNNRMNAVEAQIGVITDELVRLDQSVQDTRGAVQEGSGVSAGMPGGTYRTPSGFELPGLSIQQALKGAGYYNGTMDGKIGSETKQAVEAFQKDHDLHPDGVVGRQTWNKLKVYLPGTVK